VAATETAGRATLDSHDRTTLVAVLLFLILAAVVVAWVAMFGWTAPSVRVESQRSSPDAFSTADVDPNEGVAVTRCSNTVLEGAAAWGEVVNASKRWSDYRITVAFEEGDGDLLAEGMAVVENVKPGQTADWAASGFVAEGIATRCRLANVERLAS